MAARSPRTATPQTPTTGTRSAPTGAASALLALQRRVGNRAVTALVQGLFGRPRQQPAKLTSASLTTTVRDDEPTVKGHTMRLEMNVAIPAGVGPLRVGAGEAEYARDLYGTHFQWWEEIINDYDFTEADPAQVAARKAAKTGGWSKPWSDIYLSNPQSQTFYDWKTSIRDGVAGRLTAGTHTTGLRDRPAVNLSPGAYKRRTLRFRIDAGDADGTKFRADAIQVLKVEDGVLASSYYHDSTGTTLQSNGAEVEAMRYTPGVSPDVRTTDAARFVRELLGRKKGCRRFANTELDQIEQQAMAVGGNALFALQRGVIHKDVNESNRLNAVPLVPAGDRYWETTASDGGLLVAQVSGKTVKRLYHTANVTRVLSVRVDRNPVDFTVRTFEQLPLDPILAALRR